MFSLKKSATALGMEMHDVAQWIMDIGKAFHVIEPLTAVRENPFADAGKAFPPASHASPTLGDLHHPQVN